MATEEEDAEETGGGGDTPTTVATNKLQELLDKAGDSASWSKKSKHTNS